MPLCTRSGGPSRAMRSAAASCTRSRRTSSHSGSWSASTTRTRGSTCQLFRQYLEGGEMVEWGAKTIPEGGYYSIPDRRSGNGCVVLGDSAGYVEVASLKGVHYAVQSGILAARAIFDGLKKGDVSAAALSA